MNQRAAVLAVCCSILTGCSATASPQPSSFTPPHDGGSYATPKSLAAAITAHTPVACAQFAEDHADVRWPSGTCDDLGALVVVFGAADRPATVAAQLTGRDSRTFLSGRNWLIAFAGDGRDAAKVQAGLGGTIGHVPARKPDTDAIERPS
ncbi:MAG: hypothetical protein QOD41_4515 [Cryptosporangiaceae bacterium]|jgi:hypothetical protein|nr:hypothetical protein [Cryptosporangiaceae bacterium]